MKKIFFTFTLIILTLYSFASIEQNEIDKLWEDANSSYASGDYQKSIEIYTKLENEVGISPSLYYNIGNCYFKDNKLANAILYYNRALKMDSHNSDILHNLSVANALTTNKIKEVPEFFLVRWIESVRNIFNSNTWALISIFAIALLLAMIVMFFLSRNSSMRKSGFTIAIISLVITILSITAATSQKQYQLSDDKYIVMINSTAIKSSPDGAGKDIFILNEGVKVVVEESVGKWSKIIIASGDSGWLETSNIEKI